MVKKKVIKSKKRNSKKPPIYSGIMRQFNAVWGQQYSNPTILLKTGNHLLKISSAEKLESAIGYSKLLIGTARFFLSSDENPLSHLLEADQIFEKLRDDDGRSKTLSILGNVYENSGEYPDAITSCQKALRIMKSKRDLEGEGNVLGTLGNIYIHLQDYPNAIKSISRSLSIRKKMKNLKAASSSLNLLGRAHSLYGKFREAQQFYTSALKLREEIKDTSGIPWSYLGLASMYELKGKYSEAVSFYEKGIKSSGNLKDRRNYLHCILGMGRIMNKKNVPDKALKYLKEAEQIAKSIHAKSLLVEIHLALAESYEKKKNIQLALTHYKENYRLREELLNENTTNKLRNQMINFAVENYKKEKEIFRLKNVDLKEVLNSVKVEKKRSDELLLNILPFKIAQELKKTGQAKTQLYEEVSVIFIDFKGFTEIAQKLSPKDLIAEIDECFSAFDLIMEKHGVEKIKTIGDSYMAASGLPEPSLNHTDKLLLAAMEVIRFMQEQKNKKGNNAFEIRIGIHTGPVVAGIVGKRKFAYDIWGDTVNTSKRIETSGVVGKINVSETTFELIKDKFPCVYRGQIEVKGKGELKMYFVETEHPGSLF